MTDETRTDFEANPLQQALYDLTVGLGQQVSLAIAGVRDESVSFNEKTWTVPVKQWDRLVITHKTWHARMQEIINDNTVNALAESASTPAPLVAESAPTDDAPTNPVKCPKCGGDDQCVDTEDATDDCVRLTCRKCFHMWTVPTPSVVIDNHLVAYGYVKAIGGYAPVSMNRGYGWGIFGSPDELAMCDCNGRYWVFETDPSDDPNTALEKLNAKIALAQWPRTQYSCVSAKLDTILKHVVM